MHSRAQPPHPPASRAPSSLCAWQVRAPMPPVYMFVIDVSYAAVSSGALAAVASAIRASLDGLPGDERTQVGILTFDSTLHFYNLRASLSAPQMLVVTELDEPFVPLPDDLLVNLHDSRPQLDALLESLPSTFAGSAAVDAATGPAMQAAFMVVAHFGGKMLLFQTSAPSLGIGKIKVGVGGADGKGCVVGGCGVRRVCDCVAVGRVVCSGRAGVDACGIVWDWERMCVTALTALLSGAHPHCRYAPAPRARTRGLTHHVLRYYPTPVVLGFGSAARHRRQPHAPAPDRCRRQGLDADGCFDCVASS
eukprot:355827-Chlamydomonas_euryale.AAC.20